MLRVVIVGSGVAAHRAALELTKAEQRFLISMVSDEISLPYDRPALSKHHLQGTGKSIVLPNSEIYGEKVTRLLGRVEEVDTASSRIRLDGGDSPPYDRLLLATGSRLRRLPLPEVEGVHYLRTLEDAERLRRYMRPGNRIGIVGGGFVGLEVAASAVELGATPIVLEAADHLLGRVGSPHLSQWATRTHRLRGVEIRLGSTVNTIETSGGRLHVHVGGDRLSLDAVVIGIGIVPNTELAVQASLVVDDGIMVDEHCVTSDQRIWAAGEVTRYPVRFTSRHIRSESWTSAGEQGAAAGRSIAGDNEAIFEDCPWLWSDQFSHNIQSLGLPSEARHRRVYGDPESDKWLEIGFDQRDQFIGAIGLNVGRHVSAIRRALRSQKPIPAFFPELEPAATFEGLLVSTRN